MAMDLTSSTIWVVFLYGLFTNLNNFGIDQSFVQRYHTARSDSEARRSVWFAAVLYIPVSLLFFFIGSGLFSYYEARPVQKSALEQAVVAQREQGNTQPTPEDLGDRVFPHFIANQLPPGAAGLLMAALFAAAMSSIDTSLNSSATVILSDLYPRRGRTLSDREAMRVLYMGTVVVGCLGTGTALAMMGVTSVLDAWWTLSGIFAGGMLGLFLLGMISKRAQTPAAVTGVLVGLAVIVWMTLSPRLPEASLLRSPFHANMIIVVGTLTIFLIGILVAPKRSGGKPERRPSDRLPPHPNQG